MPDAEIQEILVEIEEKKKKADELALEFRRLYRESQEAYADGDGELAKELSEEGHEAQDECEALNEEVADLYDKLKALNEQKKKLLEVGVLPMMALKGIPQEFQQAIRDALELLPAHHVSSELIDRISYSDRYVILDPAKGIPQQAKTEFPLTGSKPYIVINRQTSNGRFISKKDIQIAVVHEVGHVVYEKVLTDEKRAYWLIVMDEIYAQLEDPDEDARVVKDEFARAYAAYQLDDSDWQREFPEEYEFFKNLDIGFL